MTREPPRHVAPHVVEFRRGTSRGRGRSIAMSFSMRPGPAVITTTRSASSVASSTECVTKIDRHAGARPDLQQLVLQLLARERVERAERLVHQQDVGLVREHARDRDALLHAARKLATGSGRRSARGRPCCTNSSVISLHLAAASPLWRGPNAMFSPHGQPGKQRVVLEHHAAVAARAGDRVVVDATLARRWLLEAGDDAQQRRLAAARGADQADELALCR